MEMQSIWSSTENFLPREPLKGDLTTDAAVIGGGMAGILTAYFLKQHGVEPVVLEAKTVGSGQTRNTTACPSAWTCGESEAPYLEEIS